jgi:hypothetical protein
MPVSGSVPGHGNPLGIPVNGEPGSESLRTEFQVWFLILENPVYASVPGNFNTSISNCIIL